MIALEAHGDVALLRMRAGKANAMNAALLEALSHALDETCDARALVITGDGTAFSAGLALPDLIELDRGAMGEFIDRFERTMAKVFACKCATVAAINGHAFAGGCVLALMCDVRVMSAGKIGLNEVQIGIGLPSIVVEPLRVRVPPSAYGPIALEGRLFTAEEAARLQLVDEVVEPAALEARTIAIAQDRATVPAAYAQIKSALLAPVLASWAARREALRETWLDTWFSEHGQRLLRATVDRITKRS